MERINDRQVILTERELKATEVYDAALEFGASIPEAVNAMTQAWPDLDPEFVAWRSQ